MLAISTWNDSEKLLYFSMYFTAGKKLLILLKEFILKSQHHLKMYMLDNTNYISYDDVIGEDEVLEEYIRTSIIEGVVVEAILSKSPTSLESISLAGAARLRASRETRKMAMICNKHNILVLFSNRMNNLFKQSVPTLRFLLLPLIS